MSIIETINNFNITPSGKMLINSKKSRIFISGAVGSGKSTAAMIALVKRGMEQPLYGGVRRSRLLLSRSTRPEILMTLLKTFLMLFPTTKMKYGHPITGTLSLLNDKNELCVLELVFLAVGNKKDVDKIKSFEITWGYLNEVTGIPYEVYVAYLNRIGRYPSKMNGGVNSYGIICDTNAFPTTHWLKEKFYKDFPVICPETGDFLETDDMLLIRQPPALKMFQTKVKANKYANSIGFTVHKSLNNQYFVQNPHCDNLTNLPDKYYTASIEAKTTPDIRVNYMGHFMSDDVGSAVCYPMFKEYLHITEETQNPKSASLVALGWDFGLTPACVITYTTIVKDEDCNAIYKVHVAGEVLGINVGLEQFVPEVTLKLNELGIQISDTLSFIDVAGQQRAQSDESTCLSVLNKYEFQTGGTVTQNVMSRLEAVRNLFYTEGQFTVHSGCTSLIQGFISDYKFSDLMLIKGILKPDKDNSHIQDALQYVALGIDTLYDIDESITGF